MNIVRINKIYHIQISTVNDKLTNMFYVYYYPIYIINFHEI